MNECRARGPRGERKGEGEKEEERALDIPGLGHKHRLQITKLDLRFTGISNDQYHSIDAYERLLLEVMRGIQVLFVRRDEVENAWEWVDSIIDAWRIDNTHSSQLNFYQAGTWGPEASSAMMERDGRVWNENELND